MSSSQHCPKCGAVIVEGSSFYSKCGSAMDSTQLTTPESFEYTSPLPYSPAEGMMKSYVTYGIISAVISLFIIPEIFGSISIILGAYIWKNDQNKSNKGLHILILGIVCMFIGVYYTS